MTVNLLKYSDKAVSHFQSARRNLELGRLFAAYRQLRIAEEFGYDSYTILLYKGRVERCYGKFQHALKTLEQLVDVAIFDGEVFLELGCVCKALKKREQALEYLKTAFRSTESRWIRVAALHTLLTLQSVNAEKKEKLLSIACAGKKAAAGSYQYRRTEALLEEMAGNWRSSFLAFRALIAERPGFAAPLLDITRISAAMNNTGLALAALKRYRKGNVFDPVAAADYARLLFKCGKYRRAAAVLKSITDSDIRSSAIYVNIAHCCILSGLHISGIRAYKKAIAIDPEDPAAYFGIAVIYHQNGSLDIAEDYYRQAFLSDPEDCRILYNLGNLLYESGDYNSSIRAFHHCLQLCPDFEEAKNNLKFVMMAKICYPEDGPELNNKKRTSLYWIGAASIAAIVLLSVLQGWF